uniref:Uncharacterized protein n=1 Tax=Amazona collaria TaxID=241587 RepID=A0A8B9G6Q2_9PSIT
MDVTNLPTFLLEFYFLLGLAGSAVSVLMQQDNEEKTWKPAFGGVDRLLLHGAGPGVPAGLSSLSSLTRDSISGVHNSVVSLSFP